MISRVALFSYAAVKHRVDAFDHWAAWQKFRRGFQAPFYRLPDTGLFGLTPLRMHILICGFQASGTTLLQLMMENSFPQARRFGKERSGWRAATYSLRNHELLISKQPRDMLRLEPLKQFYKSRRAKLRIILMLRDPRNLLTTRASKDGTGPYGGSAAEWRTYYRAFCQQNEQPECLVVRYEDLVQNVTGEQERIERFIGRPIKMPFADFLTVDREDFDTHTLCGLRPLDTSRVSRWRQPAHADRLRDMLKQLPELPGELIKLGYEQNDDWTRPYL